MEGSSLSVEVESDLLNYLARRGVNPGTRIPPIPSLAESLGISVSKLREQLEVARTLGIVDVRPKTGTQMNEYSLYPGLRVSVRYALAVNPDYFSQISQLREHVEAGFWFEAVQDLNSDDVVYLSSLIDRARAKLTSEPVEIPHPEHKELHMGIFRRLDNIFVQGILEAYWDAYECVGLNLYTDYARLNQVWDYHSKIVDSIKATDYNTGFQALVDHFEFLYRREIKHENG
jgi:DNA-binding FadR family transcriptional regulator